MGEDTETKDKGMIKEAGDIINEIRNKIMSGDNSYLTMEIDGIDMTFSILINNGAKIPTKYTKNPVEVKKAHKEARERMDAEESKQATVNKLASGETLATRAATKKAALTAALKAESGAVASGIMDQIVLSVVAPSAGAKKAAGKKAGAKKPVSRKPAAKTAELEAELEVLVSPTRKKKITEEFGDPV